MFVSCQPSPRVLDLPPWDDFVALDTATLARMWQQLYPSDATSASPTEDTELSVELLCDRMAHVMVEGWVREKKVSPATLHTATDGWYALCGLDNPLELIPLLHQHNPGAASLRHLRRYVVA